MGERPRTADRLTFRGFHFISDDEGKHVKVRLRVKRSKKGCLFSTDPISSIWIQEGTYYICTITERCYWLELSENNIVRAKQIAAIEKIMRFWKDDNIPQERIFYMAGSVQGTLKGERFYYPVK